MEPFLSPAGRTALAALLGRGALLVFDLEGTLVPRSPEVEPAPLRPETRRLLRVAALLAPVAVISARPRADLARRLEGVPLVAMVGASGAEPGFGPVVPGARHAARALAALLRRERRDLAVWAADERSDESAFALPGVVGLRFGPLAPSRARFCVPGPEAVDLVLHELIRARLALEGRADRADVLERLLSV